MKTQITFIADDSFTMVLLDDNGQEIDFIDYDALHEMQIAEMMADEEEADNA